MRLTTRVSLSAQLLCACRTPGGRWQGRRATFCQAAQQAAQQARESDAWGKARAAMKACQIHEGVVRSHNRGGILVDCWGVRGERSTVATCVRCADSVIGDTTCTVTTCMRCADSPCTDRRATSIGSRRLSVPARQLWTTFCVGLEHSCKLQCSSRLIFA